MKLSKEIFQAVILQNLEMLFSRDAFKIRFEEIDGENTGIMMIIVFTDSNAECVKIEINGEEIRGFQFNTETLALEFNDLVKCIQSAEKKIKEISRQKQIYYVGEDYVITDFNEIAIESDTGRVLMVKRNGMFTQLVFLPNGNVDNTPYDPINITAWISNRIANGGTLDPCSAKIINFVDYVDYADDDE